MKELRIAERDECSESLATVFRQPLARKRFSQKDVFSVIIKSLYYYLGVIGS